MTHLTSSQWSSWYPHCSVRTCPAAVCGCLKPVCCSLEWHCLSSFLTSHWLSPLPTRSSPPRFCLPPPPCTSSLGSMSCMHSPRPSSRWSSCRIYLLSLCPPFLCFHSATSEHYVFLGLSWCWDLRTLLSTSRSHLPVSARVFSTPQSNSPYIFRRQRWFFRIFPAQYPAYHSQSVHAWRWLTPSPASSTSTQ